MSIMLHCSYNQGQPQFTEINPLNLTNLPAANVGVVWGQFYNTTTFGSMINQNAILTGLKQCSDVIREAGFPSPSATQYIYVENLLDAPGKGTITIADVAATQVLTENGVSIAYGTDFVNIPHSTELIQDTIQRLIQGMRELVLVPWTGFPPI